MLTHRPGTWGHLSPQRIVIRSWTSFARSSVSFCGLAWLRSMPLSCMTARTVLDEAQFVFTASKCVRLEPFTNTIIDSTLLRVRLLSLDFETGIPLDHAHASEKVFNCRFSGVTEDLQLRLRSIHVRLKTKP
jgi:hypothetical protein